jgi:hypothetical protein
MSQFQKHPTVVDAEFAAGQHGGSWTINIGDTNIDGNDEFVYLSDHTFKQLYFPVGKDKCTFCKHERRHKTSDAICDRHEMCLFAWKEERNDEG